MAAEAATALARGKFKHPDLTTGGERRGHVTLKKLTTLWINTGTLCNLACAHCYIESSPRNDRLVYITAADAAAYFDEIRRERLPVEEIGFTGGEPFMNPFFVAMLGDALERGFRSLVLTNAMRPMMKRADELLALKARHGARLGMRVSLDHYTARGHESERGPRSWKPALDGLVWLVHNGFRVHVAGRSLWPEDEASLRAGYRTLFTQHGIALDAGDPAALLLFPEMDAAADVPEITERCWSLLGVDPDSLMCASARMIVKRKGAARPAVVACTLLPDAEAFELGHTLTDAKRVVSLNHPHCARFCVLGGGRCGT